jgi:hypothetical protein
MPDGCKQRFIREGACRNGQAACMSPSVWFGWVIFGTPCHCSQYTRSPGEPRNMALAGAIDSRSLNDGHAVSSTKHEPLGL